MKVTLQKDYRSTYTLEDLDRAKAVINYEKNEDGEMSAKDWAEYAVNEALRKYKDGGYLIEVLKAEAHTAKNCRAWELYGEGTGNMDILLDITAETSDGFIKICAYLSDVWSVDGDTPFYEHYYTRYYSEQN